MNRRDFSTSLLTLTGAAFLPWSALGKRERTGTADEIPASVARLYQRALVIDTLCAPYQDKATAEALAAVRSSGITAIHWTVGGLTYDSTIENLASLEDLAETHGDLFLAVRRHSDIARAKREGKVGILAGTQYTAPIEESFERVDMFRKFGVRIMQPTYNKRSVFGDGCLEPENKGLSPAGVNLIHKMNELGIAVDLSHSGYRTTSEAVVTSRKPVLITHSGCAAVYAHPRNKPDEILKAVADRGGYLGIFLMPYLAPSPRVPTREDVLAHLLHAINVCGADHVGIGSDGGIEKVVLTPSQKADFNRDMARRQVLGIAAPGEDRYPYLPDLNGPDHMEIIAAELAKRGQPDSTIEKVLGANFHRALGDTWGTA
jgi:membrane dipeptidase